MCPFQLRAFCDSVIRALPDLNGPAQPPVVPLSMGLGAWFQLRPEPSAPAWAVSEDCWFPAQPQPCLAVGCVDQTLTRRLFPWLDLRAAPSPGICLLVEPGCRLWVCPALFTLPGYCGAAPWLARHLICWLDIIPGFHLPIPQGATSPYCALLCLQEEMEKLGFSFCSSRQRDVGIMGWVSLWNIKKKSEVE